MSAREIIDACAAGEMPPQIALMHLAAGAQDAQDFAEAIAQARALAPSSPMLEQLCEQADRNPEAWRLTHDLLKAVDHDSSTSIERLASMFDDAVAISPAASVALYSLGDEGELARAADEIAVAMKAAGLLGQDKDVLDFGCGIGRMAIALAPDVRSVTGLDISPRMIEEAQRRCAALANVKLRVSNGRDLAFLRDASMDVVLAADVFPYLVQIGLDLAETHVSDAARVLRPGGALLILNFSYRGDNARDLMDLRVMTARAGFWMDDAPRIHFHGWDATAFLLRKPA